MSTTGTNVARSIVADALRLNWAGLEVRFAVRTTVGVAIPLILSAIAGQPLDGASAAYGALVTGLASRQGVYRTRVGAMLAASAALAISAFAGGLTGAYPAHNIALLAVWTLVFGLVGSLGRAALVVSVNACVAFVIFSNAPYDVANPAFQALMVFAGGVLQMVLLVLVWPLGRFTAERAALGTAYGVLAHYATGVRAADLGLPDTQSVAAVSAALADPQPFGDRAELAAYQALADEAERMRATLAALVTEQHLLDDVGLGSAASALRNVCRAAGPLLEDISAAVAAGREPEAHYAERRALDEAVLAVERPAREGAPYVADARALAGHLRSAMASATAAPNGGLAVEVARSGGSRVNLASLSSTADRLLANISWGSIYLRHAIRLTVASTIAVTVQHVLPLAHAQWIALTVILVLRPDFTTTFTRGIGRVAGTVVGAVIAAVIAAFHPADAAYIALAIAFAGLAFAFFNVSYALFSVAITGYIVYMLAVGGAPEDTSALDRVVATLLGGALALVAYTAWPAWAHPHVADDLADLVDAQRRFIVAVLRGYGEAVPNERAIRAAQVAAWRARANAEGSADQMAREPVRPRGLTVRDAAGLLAATRRLGIAALTLRARVSRSAGAPHELIDRLVADLDAALRTIVAALRRGEMPAELPPLRADQIVLRRALDEHGDPALEVLISETDLIVDSVETIAGIISRHD
jgi:uncharacterized membrane protein YccC